MKIVRAKPNDAAQLSEISYKSKSYWGYPEEWLQKWKDDLIISSDYISNNEVYKAELDNSIIGFCAIEQKENYFEIIHLWLLPKFIGYGFGASLLNETIRKVVPPKSLIRVESDPNALGFYQRQGFRQISKVESYPPGRYLPMLERLL